MGRRDDCSRKLDVTDALDVYCCVLGFVVPYPALAADILVASTRKALCSSFLSRLQQPQSDPIPPSITLCSSLLVIPTFLSIEILLFLLIDLVTHTRLGRQRLILLHFLSQGSVDFVLKLRHGLPEGGEVGCFLGEGGGGGRRQRVREGLGGGGGGVGCCEGGGFGGGRRCHGGVWTDGSTSWNFVYSRGKDLQPLRLPEDRKT